MNLAVTDEEKLDSWESLINTIDKSDIPIEFVRSINIILSKSSLTNNEQDIDVQKLRDHGWDNESIEEIVQETFNEHQNNIKTVNFYLDVAHVASIVQEQTNTLLEGIQ